MQTAVTKMAAAALVVWLVAGCSSGEPQAAVVEAAPSPTSPSPSPSPSVSPTAAPAEVTAAYSSLAASLAALAKDLPAMTNTAAFRTDLQEMTVALGRARDGVQAERNARFPRPDCSRVRAAAAVVHGAAATVFAARDRISERAATVVAASRRVDADRAAVAAKAAALAAALKATGSVLPPSLNAQDVATVLSNAKSAQAQTASAVADAQSAASAGAADGAALNAKATALASVC